MAGEGSGGLTASLYVIGQCIRNLITKIDYHLITALAGYCNPVILKIHVIKIQSHTFRDTYSRS